MKKWIAKYYFHIISEIIWSKLMNFDFENASGKLIKVIGSTTHINEFLVLMFNLKDKTFD